MKNITLALFLGFLFVSIPSHAAGNSTIALHDGWTLQTSSKVTGGGELISAKGYSTKGWYSIHVPSTVLAAQVAAGEYKDLYLGMNLRTVPGMTYPIGLNNFNLQPMEKNSPYAVSWWYRNEFVLPAENAGKHLWLHFNGINYRANLWINGKKIADSADFAGAYRRFEFDVTDMLKPGQTNTLAVETFAPEPDQLTINWVDWNPAPPDKDMGIWGDVYLAHGGDVSVRYPQAVTSLTGPDHADADVTITAKLQNGANTDVEGVVEAVLDDIHVRKTCKLQAGESRDVTLTSDEFPALQLKHPQLWWPAEMGTPNLHNLTVRFYEGEQLSDEQHARVGIRQITSELTSQGYLLFRVNGNPILIRGGGWSQDMLMRETHDNLEHQFDYVQDMGLNTIRLEAQLETEDFFNLADERGILVMAGWCCCDIWERWGKWTPDTLRVATESLRSQLLRLRSHASLIAWLNGSDGPPPPDVENAYLKVEQETLWPNPTISSASADVTKVTGKSGVKMTGPYDYEPPSYWLTDTAMKWGGAWGFNTETGPGPALPTLEGARKFIPKDHLWPIDAVWAYHSAGERFTTMDRFHEAMNKTYGQPVNLEDYLKKAQAMAYDGERAMFEAYGKNKYTSTGVIQWMLNNAWPSTFWHLYDYYLQPAGGYFGTKKACEPVHVQYSYDDRSVVVVNSRRQDLHGLSVAAHVYDSKMHEFFSQETVVNVNADGVASAFKIPPFPAEPANAIYFARLSLHDESGRELSSNLYWLSVNLSTLAWDKTPDTAFTPIASFEDLTALNQLAKVRPAVKAGLSSEDKNKVWVTIQNPSKTIAFQLHVGVRKAHSNEEILPVLWEDNYFSLLPGESKTVTARFVTPDAPGIAPTIVVDGWNIESVSVKAVASSTKLSAKK